MNNNYEQITRGIFNPHYVKTLFSSQTVRTTSGEKKKLLKLLLTALFLNIIQGNARNQDSSDLIEDIKSLLEERNKEKISNMYNEYHIYFFSSFEKPNWLEVDDANIDEFINLARVILGDICSEGICVLPKEKLKELIGTEKMFPNLMFSWVGIHVEQGIHPLIPEMIIWNDLKVAWNLFAQKTKETMDGFSDSLDRNEYYKNKQVKENYYKQGAYERHVTFLLVTFVESFLYNVYQMLSNTHSSERVAELKQRNKFEVRSFTDIQIMEDILFFLYPELKHSTKDSYSLYKEIVDLRDRYVHISTNIDNCNKPSMRKLVSSRGLNVEFKIEKILNMVIYINNVLSDDNLNLLHWLKEDMLINFIELELFPIV